MAESYKYSGVIYKSPTASQVDFALTTSGGDNIDYLDGDHIHVYTSTDSGKTWTEVTKGSAATEWDFKPDDSKVVRFGTAPGTSKQVRLLRITPYKTKYTTFQEGSLLTSVQLNDGEEFSMLVDQELFDETLKIRDGGKVSDQIITTAQQLAASPTWENEDTKIPSAGAAASRFDQVVGNGSSYPGNGNKGQRGKIRIDNSSTPQKMFWWDESLATPAWVEIKTEGQKGDKGDAATVAVDSTVTLEPGNDAKVTNTGTSSAAKFKFEIPKGAKGDPGTGGKVDEVQAGNGISVDNTDNTKPIVSAKLNGNTLTNGADGLSVSTPFSEPTDDNKVYGRRTNGGTSEWVEVTNASGDVTGIDAGPGITVTDGDTATPKVSAAVGNGLTLGSNDTDVITVNASTGITVDANGVSVTTPFTEPGSDGDFVRRRNGTTFTWETAPDGFADVTNAGLWARRRTAQGVNSWQTFTEGFADVNADGSFVRTRANNANTWTTAPMVRVDGTPNIVRPNVQADTLSTRGGPLLTSQVVDAVQQLNTAGNNAPNFQTSNTIRLSATGMTINAPTNAQAGQSGLFYIDAAATITAWANNYHFPENTRLTTKTGVVVIPFYVQTGGNTPVVYMGAATEDIRNA